jgi:large conductance mechanosensitive channel protein
MLQGFKNFLLRGDVIVVAVGLVIALAFSALITSFTANVINPIIQSLTGGKVGLGFQIRSGNPKTVVDLGAFITAIGGFHLAGVDWPRDQASRRRTLPPVSGRVPGMVSHRCRLP